MYETYRTAYHIFKQLNDDAIISSTVEFSRHVSFDTRILVTCSEEPPECAVCECHDVLMLESEGSSPRRLSGM